MAAALLAGVDVTVRSDPGDHWGFSEGHVQRSAVLQNPAMNRRS